MPEQPTFTVGARALTANEPDKNNPTWAEIRVNLMADTSDPWVFSYSTPDAFHVLCLTREASHQLIEALRGSLGPSGGMTITELIWGQLDEVMDRLMTAKSVVPVDMGQALGLATAIAIIRRPDAYDVDAVREEALLRWEARQPS